MNDYAGAEVDTGRDDDRGEYIYLSIPLRYENMTDEEIDGIGEDIERDMSRGFYAVTDWDSYEANERGWLDLTIYIDDPDDFDEALEYLKEKSIAPRNV